MRRTLRWIMGSAAAFGGTLIVVVALQQREIARIRAASAAQAEALQESNQQLRAIETLLASAQTERDAAVADGMSALRRSRADNASLSERLQVQSGDAAYWQGQRLREAGRRYAGELARMDLSPEGRQRLLGLLADRLDAERDAQEVGLRDGLAADPQAMALAVWEATTDVDHDIRALLDEADYTALQPALSDPAPIIYNQPASVVEVYNEAPAAQSAYAQETEPVEPAWNYASYVPYVPLVVTAWPGYASVRPGFARLGEPVPFSRGRGEPPGGFATLPPRSDRGGRGSYR